MKQNIPSVTAPEIPGNSERDTVWIVAPAVYPVGDDRATLEHIARTALATVAELAADNRQLRAQLRRLQKVM
jgi:hypothetical protein